MFTLPLWAGVLVVPARAEDPPPPPPAPSDPALAPLAPLAPLEPLPAGEAPPAPLPGVETALAPLPDAPPPAPAPQSFPGMLNPAISFNGLFLAGAQIDDGTLAPPAIGEGEEGEGGLPGAGETFGTGISIQEMELQLLAAVDPYFKANVVLAIPGGEGVEVEEGYVQLTSIPRVLVTVGKQKIQFGRENLLHTHALPTIDRSLVSQRMFGEEGFNDVGVSAALLAPTPWFSELYLAVDAGGNEGVYGSGDPLGFGTSAHWKNLFDLSPTASLELGLSGSTGLNAFGGRSVVAGADLTLKGGGRGKRQFNKYLWQTEYLFAVRDGADEDAQLGGLYSTLEYAITRRFWVGGRFDWVGLGSPVDPTFAGTGILVFVPTEFSALRLQYQRQFLPDDHAIDSVVGQLNFTIGAHPAHAY